jgi:hypothetical protein
MAEAWTEALGARIATPLSFEEPYRVDGIEPRTSTIVELLVDPDAGLPSSTRVTSSEINPSGRGAFAIE